MTDGLKLISSAMQNGAAGALFRLDREYFLGEEQTAFDAVRTHFRRYREMPNPRTIQEECGVRLPNAPEAFDYYVDQVTERFQYNQIRERFGGLRDSLRDRKMDEVRDTLSELARITRATTRKGNESLDIQQAAELVQQRLLATQGLGGITGVETPWPTLDMKTGGLQNSDLITIVARPGVGKTYLLLYAAMRAHEAGHNVLFVTTEMGIEQLGRRHASLAMGINPTFLKLNQISTYTQRRLASYYSGMMGAERLRFFAMGMNAKVDALEAYMQEFGPSIVFVDGLYLLRPSAAGAKNLSRTERVTQVFDELKALNLESDIPLVGTTQFSRQAGKGGVEGSLETIGYSDAIGTHSSIVIAAKFGPTQNPRHSRSLDFLKGREGEDGSVAINFKFAPLDLTEFTPEQYGALTNAANEDNAEGGAPAQPAINMDWMAR